MRGVIKLLPIETFIHSDFGDGPTIQMSDGRHIPAQRSMSFEENSPWISVCAAIRKNEMFSVQATSSSRDVELRFAANVEGGSYTIISRPSGAIETGRVQKVVVIPAGTDDLRFAKVAGAHFRFLIVSSTEQQPFKRRAWIVGVDDPVLVQD